MYNLCRSSTLLYSIIYWNHFVSTYNSPNSEILCNASSTLWYSVFTNERYNVSTETVYFVNGEEKIIKFVKWFFGKSFADWYKTHEPSVAACIIRWKKLFFSLSGDSSDQTTRNLSHKVFNTSGPITCPVWCALATKNTQTKHFFAAV